MALSQVQSPPGILISNRICVKKKGLGRSWMTGTSSHRGGYCVTFSHWCHARRCQEGCTCQGVGPIIVVLRSATLGVHSQRYHSMSSSSSPAPSLRFGKLVMLAHYMAHPNFEWPMHLFFTFQHKKFIFKRMMINLSPFPIVCFRLKAARKVHYYCEQSNEHFLQVFSTAYKKHNQLVLGCLKQDRKRFGYAEGRSAVKHDKRSQLLKTSVYVSHGQYFLLSAHSALNCLKIRVSQSLRNLGPFSKH